MKDIDELFTNAVKATDNGDYHDALNNLTDVIDHAGEIFGDTDELNELKAKITEIYSLLDDSN